MARRPKQRCPTGTGGVGPKPMRHILIGLVLGLLLAVSIAIGVALARWPTLMQLWHSHLHAYPLVTHFQIQASFSIGRAV